MDDGAEGILEGARRRRKRTVGLVGQANRTQVLSENGYICGSRNVCKRTKTLRAKSPPAWSSPDRALRTPPHPSVGALSLLPALLEHKLSVGHGAVTGAS